MNDTAIQPQPSRQRPLQWVLLEFLGSMNLAITLLVVVAIASVIGTVLQQNQPYPDYVLKFGPFWFAIFRELGLYDVYGAGWFIAILGFLVLSTSVCIYRQTPLLWREMTRFRTKIRLKSLRGFQQHAEWQWSQQNVESALQDIAALLRRYGYRWRVADHGDHQVVAAVNGRINRLGYLFTHAAVVVICIGGLLDGTIWLQWQEWRGKLHVETRDLAARDIPPASRLSPADAPPSFRGNIMLPEGAKANFAFLRVRNGFVLQELPFAIELKDFQVAYYDSGQPKTFISEVLIHDKEHLGDQPLAATIRVNHPLVYRGYALYQSDFGDGGSKLDLRAWPLFTRNWQAAEVQGKVGATVQVGGAPGGLSIELAEFRLFNLQPQNEAQPDERRFRNLGSSINFKLRDATGQAREYFNYMTPIEIDGRWFFVSGTRERPDQAFNYLHIPADSKNSPERFLRFNARLRDSEGLQALFERLAGADASSEFNKNFNKVRLSLLELVMRGGFNAVAERAKAVVPAERLEDATNLYLNIVRESLAEVFLEVLREEGMDVAQGLGDNEQAFFNDAVSTLAVLREYGAPFYLQLAGFEQIEASGLQVTRSSGASVVYLGFALLTIGVFLMFYSVYRRLWVWLEPAADGTLHMVLAGVANRRHNEFASEFAQIRSDLEQLLRVQ